MIALSNSLLLGQRARTILAKNLLTRCVLTYGSTEYEYTKTLIKELYHTEQHLSHKANLLLDDTSKALHSLDLHGYKAVFSYGLVTKAGEEWVATAPMWVVSQQRQSYPDRLECQLNFEGIFDRMAKHKATASYTPESGDTRTVKDWLTEIICLTDSGSESEETQETYDDEWKLHGAGSGACYNVGQKLTISSRRVTKLAFKLKKVGNPTGEITFFIDSVATGSELAKKVWGNAYSLTTSYQKCSVTFDTPVWINEEVRIHCEFINGDASNYVSFLDNITSVKAGECLTQLSPLNDDWVDLDGTGELGDYDAVYYYSYSATPCTVYGDYPAYGLVFDSEDNLIDSFCPADAFRINLNESRKDKIRQLLGYTDCVARVGNDELIHILLPTTSGTTYDALYSLVQGRDYHNFFSKESRNRIVSPNYIIFASHPSSGDSASGYAKDASADLTDMLEKETHYVRSDDNDECEALATAFLSKMQMADEKGSGILAFMHLGQEVYDYVNFVDSRAGDSRAGNVGFLTRYYKPGQFNMHIGFGSLGIGAAALLEGTLRGEESFHPSTEQLYIMIKEMGSWFSEFLDEYKIDQEKVDKTFLDLYEDAYFRKATVSSALNIPSEAA